MDRVVINCTTGEVEVTPLTAQEQAEYDAHQNDPDPRADLIAAKKLLRASLRTARQNWSSLTQAQKLNVLSDILGYVT